jgi:molecular chaperone HscB
MNYYEILEIPSSYNIDESQLTEAYLRKQALFHPDAGNKKSSSKDSALLNAAYSTLLNPVKRGEYWLSLNNVDANAIHSNELTLQIFEQREKYESLVSEGDKRRFRNNLSAQISMLVSRLCENEKNPEAFQKIFCELRFINAFLDNVGADGDHRN